MTRAEALAAIAELHTAWALKYGDEVAYDPADENPHDGETTDLALWQADRSAPADIDDELNEQIMSILAQVEDDPVVIRPTGPDALAGSGRVPWAGCPYCFREVHDGPCGGGYDQRQSRG